MRKEAVTYNTQKKRTLIEEENNSTTFIIEKDYTQLYDCFSSMSRGIDSGTSYKLLFWLLANKTNKDGGIHIDKTVYQQFNDFLTESCNQCSISDRTFFSCVAELRTSGVLVQKGKGYYEANTFSFWRGTIKQRREKLIADHRQNQFPVYNPDHDTKLLR